MCVCVCVTKNLQRLQSVHGDEGPCHPVKQCESLVCVNGDSTAQRNKIHQALTRTHTLVLRDQFIVALGLFHLIC